MQDAAKVLSAIKSPLALAALSLLVVAQVMRGLSKNTGARKTWTPVAEKLLLLAGVLGVLAIGSFTLEASWHREYRVSGTVRDESGLELGGAHIDIAGAGSGTSSPDGSFAFTIPSDRVAATFAVDVTKDGFLPAKLSATTGSLQGLRVTLARPAWKDEDALQFGPQIAVRHFLGVPQLDLSIIVRNPTVDSLIVSDITVRVESGGRSENLIIEATYLPTGGIGSPLTILSLAGKQVFPITHALSAFAPDLGMFLTGVGRAVGASLPSNAMPDPSATYLTAALADSAVRMMNSHFFWKEGESRLHVEATFGKRRVKRDAHFLLTAQQVAGMRAVSKYYASGIGVFPNWRSLPVPGAQPMALVALTQ